MCVLLFIEDCIVPTCVKACGLRSVTHKPYHRGGMPTAFTALRYPFLISSYTLSVILTKLCGGFT
jgi:hypothetical protein